MRGSVRLLPSGSWELRWRVEGKQKSKTAAVKTERQAHCELRKILTSIDRGEYVEPTNMTVAQYLDRWLADDAKAKGHKTYERYEEIVRLHLVPALGRHLLTALTPTHIQTYYTEAQLTGRKDGRTGGLAAQTVLHHHRTIHRALGMAVLWELLSRNPADRVAPPKPEKKIKAVLDDAQTAQLLRECQGHRYYIAWLLADTTGIRRGELCGLRWQDVDLDRGKIIVVRARGETRHGGYFKATKTDGSARTVDLPQTVVRRIVRHKGEQAQRRLHMGDDYRNHDLVICHDNGEPLSPNTLSRSYYNLRKKLGVEVTLHGLRHSHASELLRRGEHVKVVSERLGHHSPAFTLDTYAHLLPSQQEEAAQRVDERLRAALGDD